MLSRQQNSQENICHGVLCLTEFHIGFATLLKNGSITGVRFYNIFQTATVLDTNERLFTSSCTKSKVKC